MKEMHNKQFVSAQIRHGKSNSSVCKSHHMLITKHSLKLKAFLFDPNAHISELKIFLYHCIPIVMLKSIVIWQDFVFIQIYANVGCVRNDAHA